MPTDIKYIARVKLSDNTEYVIKDINALHNSGGTLTGDLEVDAKIKADHLYIMEIQEIEAPVTNVLTIDSNGEVKKRSADDLLSDIGGASYSIDSQNNILKLKIGK